MERCSSIRALTAPQPPSTVKTREGFRAMNSYSQKKEIHQCNMP